jgi:hypothetical protein
MKTVYKILILVGAIFALVGAMLTFIFLVNRDVFGLWSLFPLFFVALGLCFIIPGIIDVTRTRKIIKNGRRISAKIYDYCEDTSATVNGAYPVNTVVRYFDSYGKECETVLETGFLRGSNEFPIGMTIDIYEYNGKIGYDKDSVRSETIFREEELMDNKPINTAGMEVVAIECKSCGASFCATKGYVSKCPYCGKLINA